jgi:uncharacterized protein (TIGR03086 family)
MAKSGPLSDLDHAISGAEAIVSGVKAVQWTDPTPCTGLDVRAVVNHLVTGNRAFTAYVTGGPAPAKGADLLGEDPAGAFGEAGSALRGAFGAAGALDELYKAPKRPVPGGVLLQVRVLEHLAHGWDLARATGQAPDFPDAVVDRALALARQTLSSRPAGPDAPYGPEVTVPDGAPLLDQLAGFLGRTVV